MMADLWLAELEVHTSNLFQGLRPMDALLLWRRQESLSKIQHVELTKVDGPDTSPCRQVKNVLRSVAYRRKVKLSVRQDL